MQHRNLKDNAGFTAAAIDNILERGTPEDWKILADEVIKDPHGGLAQRVYDIAKAHYMYGTSALWVGLITKWRGEDPIAAMEAITEHAAYRSPDVGI